MNARPAYITTTRWIKEGLSSAHIAMNSVPNHIVKMINVHFHTIKSNKCIIRQDTKPNSVRATINH